MNLKIIFALFLVSLSIKGKTQENYTTNLHKSYDIHIMPYGFADLVPRFRLGAEYYHNPKWSYCLDVGFRTPQWHSKTIPWRTTWDNYRLFEIRPEVKYFFKHHGNKGWFLSGEVFYLRFAETRYNSYYFYGNYRYRFSYASANYYRHKAGIHIGYGYKIYRGERTVIECYAGIGGIYKAAYLKDDEGDAWAVEGIDHDLYDLVDHESRSFGFLPSMRLGAKIGIFIKKNSPDMLD